MAESNTSIANGGVLPKNGTPAQTDKVVTDEGRIVYLQGIRFAMLAALFVCPLSPHQFINSLAYVDTLLMDFD